MLLQNNFLDFHERKSLSADRTKAYYSSLIFFGKMQLLCHYIMYIHTEWWSVSNRGDAVRRGLGVERWGGHGFWKRFCDLLMTQLTWAAELKARGERRCVQYTSATLLSFSSYTVHIYVYTVWLYMDMAISTNWILTDSSRLLNLK